MRHLVFLSWLIFGQLACNSLKRSSTPPSDTFDASETVFLGKGYDTETFQSLEICTKGEERVEMQPQANWAVTAVRSWESMRRDLGYESEAEFTYRLTKGDPKAKFTLQLRDTELSESYILTADYVTSTRFYTKVEIQPERLARAQGGKEQQLDFRRHCGDQFINQVDMGGKLRVLVKFRFSNKGVKEVFNFSANIQNNTATPEFNSHQLSEDERNHSYVDISFYQEGGDISRLGTEVSMGSTMECSLASWEACKQFIIGLVGYSIGSFPQDVKSGLARAIAYRTTAYDEIILPGMSEEARIRKQATALELERQHYDLTKTRMILAHPDNYGINDRKMQLESIASSLARNIEKLQTNITQCIEFREDEQRCVDVSALSLENYDPTRLVAGSARVEGPSLGNTRGEMYQRTCNNLMVGASGYTGRILDKLEVICDDGITLPAAGYQPARNTYHKTCPAGHVVTGMRGSLGNDRLPGSLTFMCGDLAILRANQPRTSYPEINIFGRNRDFAWDCPPGFAATGIKGRQAKFVDSLILICANL